MQIPQMQIPQFLLIQVSNYLFYSSNLVNNRFLPPTIFSVCPLFPPSFPLFHTMLTCFKWPVAAARTVLQQVRVLDKFHRCKRRQHKRLFSGFDLLASSFTAMEVSNQLKQVFRLLDTNGDGKISSFELSEVLLWLGQEKSTAVEEAEGMVREVDCNGDGFIDLDEFMRVMNTDFTVGSSSTCDDGLMDAFLIFDSDKNGVISAEELQRVLISLGCVKCSLQECKRMIKGVDKDGDGFVDFEEFRSMMTGCASTKAI